MLRVIALGVLLSTICTHGFAENTFWSLCYHDVRDEVDADLDTDSMAVSTLHLMQHFEWLRINGYHPISIQDIVDARRGVKRLPDKAVLLSFDDGYASFYTKIFPLLKLYDYPAVFALVAGWLEIPAGEFVTYGKEKRPRSEFLSWAQVREMQASGLVEIASHSYNHHRGVVANPQGNTQAAFVTRNYLTKERRYETQSEWYARVAADLRRSADVIEQRTGVRPRVMVWPYGKYNRIVDGIAKKEGMEFSLTLEEATNHVDQDEPFRRYLISHNPPLKDFLYGLKEPERPEPRRVVHVELDYLYDLDTKRRQHNLDLLVSRIYRMGINTVFLQAFSDLDGDGSADALYFPNRHLPMRADLFNRVAWQLYTRANVDVYAWMPVSAFALPEEQMQRLEVKRIADEWRLGGLLTFGIPENLEVKRIADAWRQRSDKPRRRLSIFHPEARELIKDIYQDLAKYTAFQGILYDDDAVLSEQEDVSDAALAYYRKAGLLPKALDSLGQEDRTFDQWAQMKTDALTGFTLELTDTVRRYRPLVKTARNLYALPVMKLSASQWYSQSLQNFSENYDYSAIKAMPYAEDARNPRKWLRELAEAVVEQGHPEKTVFELQSVDWRKERPIRTEELVAQMRLLQRAGIVNYGYYPDDFIHDHPKQEQIKPGISLESYPYARM